MRESELIMRLEDNLESLYDVDLETGEYELFLKGKTFSEKVNGRLVDGRDFFADSQKNINRVVYPDDREKFAEVINRDYIREALGKNNHLDWYYRLVVEDDPVWFRVRIVYKDETKGSIIVGIFNAAEEVKKRKQSEKLRDEFVNRMMGDGGVFVIDCIKDTRKTIRDDLRGAGRYSDEDPYTTLIQRYIETSVAEPDRELMRECTDPANMLARACKEEEYTVEYRDTTNGRRIFYEMKVTHFSETEVLQSFSEKDEEIINRKIYAKLQDDYFAFLRVDLDVGMMQVLKKSPWYKAMAEAGQSMDYRTAMLDYSETCTGEAEEFFRRISDTEYLRKKFAKKDRFSYTYYSPNVDDGRWVNVVGLVLTRHRNGIPSLFSLSFSLLDEDASRTQDIQRKLKKALFTITEEKVRFDIVKDIINAAQWSFKISADDEVLSVEHIGEIDKVLNRNLPEEPTAWREIVHPDDKEAAFAAFDATIKDHSCRTPYDVTYRMLDRDGKYNWFRSAGRMLRHEDGSGEFLGIHMNITEITEKEQEYQRTLQEALYAAERGNRSKSEFLFNMSHDIRTPMNAMLGFSAMARKYADDSEKVKNYLDKIELSGHQLLTLINHVLEMARIESGKVELEEKPINIPERFSSMVTVLSEQARACGLDFHYALEDIEHFNVLADEARMSSITMNIAGNAMKYTPEGGRVDFIFREIPCKKTGYASYVLTVSDTGIGMSEEYQKVLFEPFSREKSTTVSRVEGTGLGLSIVKSLVDVMGGTIDVKSEIGKGTRFDISISLKIDKDERTPIHPRISAPRASFAGNRVLLVEDNEMNMEIAKHILEENGLLVDEAEDGEIAVAMIRQIADRGLFNYYDIILMDVQMPVMNGYDATRAIREILDRRNVHIPIIAMTANAFEEDRQNALAAGMDEHIAKPIDIEILIDTLARFIHST